jgi:uncharacterized membrane protein YhhN
MYVYWLVMAALVGALLWVVGTGRHAWEWVVKPAAAATFLLAALAAGALDGAFGRVLFAGLVLAAGGDVLLIPKSKRAFLFGLVSFLLGHLGYAVAFVVRGVDPVRVVVASVLLAGLSVPVLRWLWPHVERPMRGPVVAYVVVITAMVALAAGTAGLRDGGLLLVGAIAFYLSDLAVARERFVSKGFVNRAWGLPLYFFAQLLLASQSARG